MSFKKIWKTGHSYVVCLSADEINHLELFTGNNVTVTCHGKREIRVIRYPKHLPRKT